MFARIESRPHGRHGGESAMVLRDRLGIQVAERAANACCRLTDWWSRWKIMGS